MKSSEIYILEDDVAVREELSAIYGDALIARARKQYPLCILLDLNLPGKSGMEILNERGEDYLAPAIIISAPWKHRDCGAGLEKRSR